MSQWTRCPNDDCDNKLSEDSCHLVRAYLAGGDISGEVICDECGHRISVGGNMKALFDKTALENQETDGGVEA